MRFGFCPASRDFLRAREENLQISKFESRVRIRIADFDRGYGFGISIADTITIADTNYDRGYEIRSRIRISIADTNSIADTVLQELRALSVLTSLIIV